MSSNSDDDMILDICKQLKIKVPIKKFKPTSIKKTYPLSNLENVDLNNLPFMILSNPEDTTDSSLIPQNSTQTLESCDFSNNVAEEVIIELVDEEPSAVIEEQIVEPSIVNTEKQPETLIEAVWDEQLKIVPQRELIVAEDEKESDVIDQFIVCEQNEETSEIVTEYILNEQTGLFLQTEEIAQSEEIVEVETVNAINSVGDNTLDEYHGDLNSKRKRKIKGLIKPKLQKEWTKNKSKLLRMEGKQYLGYRRDNQGQSFKVLNDIMRPARKIGPQCTSQFCVKSKLRGCNNITEEERQNIFSFFWKNLDWSRRRQYVVTNVESGNKKQIKQTDDSRRHVTKHYFLTTEAHGRVQVCLKTFLSTLGITENSVRYWADNSENGMTNTPKVRQPDKQVRDDEHAEYLKSFFDSLPKVPSHYCRASSTKLYLEPVVQSKSKLYKLYCEKCHVDEKKPASRWLFDQIFLENNLSIFSPRKDQCDVCCSYNVGNIDEAIYRAHLLKKDRARQEKIEDKTKAINKEVHVFTHDLQSVQLCPKLEASAIYYKTKLCVHNFTMYNLESKDVHCYWFDECTAGLVASVYTSCIVDCLKKTLAKKLLPVILYSDGCTAQNRNVVLSNALLELAMDFNIDITQKILEKGHTQMEVDSTHSAIECQVRKKDIYLPSQYGSLSKEARPQQPYIVNYLSYDFFYDYTKHGMYDSIRPGRVANDPVVTELRVLLYEPKGVIKYKLNYDDEFALLPRRPKARSYLPRPKLYQSRLPISQVKWNHLQELKHVIPHDCHSFYDGLPHK